jgi:hypothetical protein
LQFSQATDGTFRTITSPPKTGNTGAR